MFTFTTATYTEQEARKADLTGDTFTGVVSARAGATKGNGTVGDFGINVDGVTYNAFDKVQDSASTNRASVIIQRDSTTLPLLIVGALNNSENTAYTAVVAGQTLVGLLGVGTTTSTTYDKFGEVSIVVGTGTVSGTSSPGKFIVKLTPDGSNTPVEVMRIDSDGAVVFAGTVSLGSSTVTTLSVGDGTVAAPSITNTGDTNTGIYFSAADTVDITTAGARAVSVASDQSVTFFGNTYVGLATAAASSVYDLFISTDTAANRGFALQKSVTASNGPNLHLRKSRGTTAAPSVPADGDTLGNLAAQSYAGPRVRKRRAPRI